MDKKLIHDDNSSKLIEEQKRLHAEYLSTSLHEEDKVVSQHLQENDESDYLLVKIMDNKKHQIEHYMQYIKNCSTDFVNFVENTPYPNKEMEYMNLCFETKNAAIDFFNQQAEEKHSFIAYIDQNEQYLFSAGTGKLYTGTAPVIQEQLQKDIEVFAPQGRRLMLALNRFNLQSHQLGKD